MPMPPFEYYWSAPLRCSLTGARRYRVQKWTHRVVLEVQWTGEQERMFSGETKTVTWWMDARPQDLLHETKDAAVVATVKG